MGDLLWVINQVDRRHTPRPRPGKPQQAATTKSEPVTYVATRRKSKTPQTPKP